MKIPIEVQQCIYIHIISLKNISLGWKKSIIEGSILISHITEYRLCLSTTKIAFFNQRSMYRPDGLLRAE